MIILHDPDTLRHETIELLGAKTRPALESPERIKAIVAQVARSKHELRIITSPIAYQNSSGDLSKLIEIASHSHSLDYLQHLKDVFGHWRAAELVQEHESVLPECFAFSHSARTVQHVPTDIYARAGYFAFDMSCGVMKQTYTSIIASANLAYQAANLLSSSNATRDVFALTRPPGHHCDGRRAGGYCYINNAAVAVSTWHNRFLDTHVGILDIDFHHGNGTQEIYYNNPLVFYTSIHGEGEFPYYTGFADETGGSGDALDTNLNLPLKPGSSFEEYQVKLNTAIDTLVRFRPKFLVISLGFDTFYLDPLGRFKIETGDYETMARTIRQKLSDMPAAILLEGGYVLEHLGENVLSFIKGWESSAEQTCVS